MFNNYLKIAFRTLWNNKLYSLINILGLGIAMAVVLLIAVYVSYEFSFDKMHHNHEQIVRPTFDLIDSEHSFASNFPGLGEYLKANYEVVEDFARIHTPTQALVKPFIDANTKFIEEKCYHVDANLFDILSFEILKSGTQILSKPNQVLISSLLANKYFGNKKDFKDQIIGKTISIQAFDHEKLYNIIGIFKNPINSHFQPDILLPYSALPQWQRESNSFNWPLTYTYLKLRPEADLYYLKHEIDRICHENAWNKKFQFNTILQPVAEIHHNSNYPNELEAGGNKRSNYFLIGVAIFIVICAWINYINMAITKSMKRVKEIGVRKTLGAKKNHVVQQFLWEGLWLNVFGGILAINLAILGYPLLNNSVISSELVFPLQLWINGEPSVIYFIMIYIGLIVFGSLISGIYPAIILSNFHPIDAFKGLNVHKKYNLNLRQGLLSFQFIVSALLITGVFAAMYQLRYMLNKDLGFEQEHKLIIKAETANINSLQNYLSRGRGLKNKLANLSQISSVTTSSTVPGENYTTILLRKDQDFNVEGAENLYTGGPSPNIMVGPDFFDFYNIRIKSGRKFSPSIFSDTSTVNKKLLVNEKFAEVAGFDSANQMLGKTIYVDNTREPAEIIGIVENHHHFSVKEAFVPMVFSAEGGTAYQANIKKRIPRRHQMRYFSLKIASGSNPSKQIPELISKIEKLWQTHFPELPFSYFFLDDAFNNQYKKDIRLSKIFTVFASLSIFISCLGLFGLSSFLIQQRTKEIGIRKILGASLKNLFSLLSKNYIRLVAIASLISVPLAYWGIEQWLQNYAFRIDVSWWFFVVPLLALLAIAIITISFKIISTAKANPVEALRYE